MDFITKANDICRALSAQEHAKPSASNDPRTAFDNNLRYLNDALGKLDKLKPPTDSEAKFSDMRKQLHSMVAFLKQNRLYLVALTVHLQQHPEDTKALHQFERKIKAFDRNAANAKRDSDALTLNACSAGLGPAGG